MGAGLSPSHHRSYCHSIAQGMGCDFGAQRLSVNKVDLKPQTISNFLLEADKLQQRESTPVELNKQIQSATLLTLTSCPLAKDPQMGNALAVEFGQYLPKVRPDGGKVAWHRFDYALLWKRRPSRLGAGHLKGGGDQITALRISAHVHPCRPPCTATSYA